MMRVLADGKPHNAVELGRAVRDVAPLEEMVRYYWKMRSADARYRGKQISFKQTSEHAAMIGARMYASRRMYAIGKLRGLRVEVAGKRQECLYRVVFLSDAEKATADATR